MKRRAITRRSALRAALAIPLASGLARAGQPGREFRSFRLSETAGLRRYGFPVRTVVPDAAEGRNFRLVVDGREVPAQFRKVDRAGRSEMVLDFNANLEPLETARYEVQFGMGVRTGKPPETGLRVERRGGSIRVFQGDALTFEFADDLLGFLRSAGSSRLGYVRPGSLGLRAIGATEGPARAFSGIVTREGPFAVGLRFATPTDRANPTVVDLTVPHSKSWVEAEVTVDDPAGTVRGIELGLNLLVEGSPTLVDFGAASTVYGQIRDDRRMELVAESARSWSVRQGSGDSLKTIAATTPSDPRPAEGWAHVMDAKRSVAVAVAGFGLDGHADRVGVEADGQVAIARTFPEGRSGPKTLHFWLHFVPSPVHVGAMTSPQSILSPPRVEWDRVLKRD